VNPCCDAKPVAYSSLEGTSCQEKRYSVMVMHLVFAQAWTLLVSFPRIQTSTTEAAFDIENNGVLRT
jgi:hypothetical protein